MDKQHFAVLTADKQTGSGGGLSAHIDREVYDPLLQTMVLYQPKSVTRPERTRLNKEYILPPGKGRTAAINDRIRSAGISRSLRKDQVKALCFLCQSSPEKMKEIEEAGKLDEWVEDTLQWFYKKFGKENVVAATLHMDETTPHLHVTVVPIVQGQAKERRQKPKMDAEGNPIEVKKKRRYKKQTVTARLCAADVMTRTSMKAWQTGYALAMKKWGMVRGIEGHGAQRVDPAIWKQQQELTESVAQLRKENTELSKEKVALEQQTGIGAKIGAFFGVGELAAVRKENDAELARQREELTEKAEIALKRAKRDAAVELSAETKKSENKGIQGAKRAILRAAGRYNPRCTLPTCEEIGEDYKRLSKEAMKVENLQRKIEWLEQDVKYARERAIIETLDKMPGIDRRNIPKELSPENIIAFFQEAVRNILATIARYLQRQGLSLDAVLEEQLHLERMEELSRREEKEDRGVERRGRGR